MPPAAARDRFIDLLRASLGDGSLTKLTLGKPCGADASLRNVFVRPVTLKSGAHFAFVWRHATRDITKNLSAEEALATVAALLGHDFLDAHLFTAAQNAQLETKPDGTARLKLSPVVGVSSLRTATSPAPLAPLSAAAHDRAKSYLIPATAPWLRALGVVNDRGQPREGMADKFRQIQKFAELLQHLLADAFPEQSAPSAPPLRVIDMGSGKGYLTFAVASLLGARARVRGIELRPDLVTLCNRVAVEYGLQHHVVFAGGAIADTPLAPGECDVLIALHACDTATDDALARGIAAGARLLVVAPCCQKELRRQLTAPAVLAPALRHGIFQERQAEFVTDALRAQLLEAAGFRTKVFEFISTEHTAKNLMIAAVRDSAADVRDPVAVERLQAFAQFYGIERHALATHLHISLTGT
jgi:SAM-dependent methyltransferase